MPDPPPPPSPLKPIPVNTPKFWGDEAQALQNCIETGWISSEGPQVKEFEERFACYVGRKYAVACSNGTAALDLAYSVLDLQEGDEVIVPTLTIISCVMELAKRGCKVVPIDCNGGRGRDSESDVEKKSPWNMDFTQLKKAITPKTKAILAVHVYEYAIDIAEIEKIVEESGVKGITIVEDSAELIGGECRGKKCGSFGTISTFSFYPNKHITTGEGGLVLTDDPILDANLRKQRNLCFDPAKRRFIHEDIGFNYRMTCLQAALGLAQLKYLDKALVRKREVGRLYNKLFKEGFEKKGEVFVKKMKSCIRLPSIKNAIGEENIFWVYMIEILSSDVSADQMMKMLAGRKVGTRPCFYPMHLQPVFIGGTEKTDNPNKNNRFKNKVLKLDNGFDYSESERLAEQSFYLPSGLALTDDDVGLVVERVIGVFEELFCPVSAEGAAANGNV